MPITRAAPAPRRGSCSRSGPASSRGLRRRDRLELRSEVQVDGRLRPAASPRCAGRPYGFDPRVTVTPRARLRGARRPGGAVIARRRLRCRQRLPEPPAPLPGRLRPARPGSATISPAGSIAATRTSVVAASSPDAAGDQRMIIGANKPSGRIVQDKSRLTAIRLSPGSTARRARRPRTCAAARCGCDRGARWCSRRSSSGSNGARCSRSKPRCARTSATSATTPSSAASWSSPGARAPPGRAGWSGARSGSGGCIGPTNGTNCTPAQSPCGTRKVGAIKVRRDVRGRSGAPARCSSTWSSARSRSGSGASTGRGCACARPARGAALPLATR